MTNTTINAAEFFDAYVECALWSSADTLPSDPEGEPVPLDSLDLSIHPDSLATMRADCDDFVAGNRADLEEAMSLYSYSGEWTPSAQAGHDFWLTRNGHGAGFWDRGIGEVGDRLTTASAVYGESNLYIGDTGYIYL